MPRYKIVVDDVDKAHKAMIESYRLHPRLQSKITRREIGTIHAEMDSECPNGGSNCRNCGDPNFIDSCKSNGHCPDCGTKHGIAPDSILQQNGYKLVLV